MFHNSQAVLALSKEENPIRVGDRLLERLGSPQSRREPVNVG
jgi:hypothetical protein